MKKKYLLLSFVIPCTLMVLLYISVGIIGGNKNVLTVDLANQYVEFFGALKNILSGITSPFYTFNKTLGGNMFGVITYYLMSPLNILIVFSERIDIPKFIMIINIIKVALSGLTSYIFFNKTYKEEKLSLTFSIIYSLMAYNIVYSQNIMWLDGVVLLPLIFRGIDKLIEKKPLMFYITLTLSIICNYYIGYMSCIASFIYYLYKIYLREDKIEIKEIINITKYILICVLTSAVVLIPSLFALLQGKANGMLGEFVPNQRFAILDLITRFYIGTFKNSDILGTLPNVYISLLATVSVIYYFFNKRIEKKERQATLILVIIFALGFVFSPINTIWHTLKNPVGFPFRYSFIFDFVLLIIAYKNILNIEEIDKNFIKKFLIYGILLTLLIDKLLYTKTMYYKIIGSFVLITIYLFYLKNKKEKGISNLIILLVTAEMFLNSYMIVYNIKYQNKEKYKKFVNQTGSIVDKINKNDNTLFRLEKDYEYSSNDALLLNYNGISHFSSVYEGKTNEFLGKYLGIFNRFYVTNYNGSTLVTNSLFNIKYLLSEKELTYYEKQEKMYDVNVYKNTYNLPIGFMVDKKIEDLELEEYKPFINQNNILKSMNENIEDVFYKNNYEIEFNNLKLDDTKDRIVYKRINPNDKASIIVKIKNETPGIVYEYMSCEKMKKVDVLLNGKSIIDINAENGYNCNILELGRYNKDDEIKLEIELLEQAIEPLEISSYTLDINKLNSAVNILKQNDELKITEYNKNIIKANINVTKKQTLYTSIPFDKGFEIRVDGKKIKGEKLFDTLLTFDLEKGNHEIEIKYLPRGIKSGLIMSILGIGVFIIERKKI